MHHEMSLTPKPFDKMRSGEKTIEIRCNDEKRRAIRVGDTITFTRLPGGSDRLAVIVEALYPHASFEELFRGHDFAEFGCAGYTMEQMLEGMRRIYSTDREAQWGALGIRVRVIQEEEHGTVSDGDLRRGTAGAVGL